MSRNKSLTEIIPTVMTGANIILLKHTKPLKIHFCKQVKVRLFEVKIHHITHTWTSASLSRFWRKPTIAMHSSHLMSPTFWKNAHTSGHFCVLLASFSIQSLFLIIPSFSIALPHSAPSVKSYCLSIIIIATFLCLLSLPPPSISHFPLLFSHTCPLHSLVLMLTHTYFKPTHTVLYV